MVVTKWKGVRGKRRKVEEPLDALEKLLRDVRANYTPATGGDQQNGGEKNAAAAAAAVEAEKANKGVLRGYLRSTSVWIYVRRRRKEKRTRLAPAI